MADVLSPSRLADLDAFLVELNGLSAEVILPLFRAEHGLENKGGDEGFDPVTAADRDAEAALRRLIGERFPDHGVIGEEYGEDRPGAEFVWVIDPIDGTGAFIAGLPVWTTLIALRSQGEPVLGSIGQPYVGELFIGGRGASRLVSRGSSRPLSVRPCPGLTQATIATTDLVHYDGAELAAWTQVRAAARSARFGCDAYAFAMVAIGAIDMVIEPGVLKPWDIEAAVPVIEGAGGLVTDWRGERVGRNGGQMVVVGDRRCLDDALVALKPAAH